ncbi:MAG TPA: S1 RNA-binding domain-containing protein [Phycisphaerae bacterium]|nr:S1 RNA-binding domain-containing protein [Phycisphaerae bacterium]
MTSDQSSSESVHQPSEAAKAHGIPFVPPPAPGAGGEKSDIEREVNQALGGLSIEELMAGSSNALPAESPAPQGSGPKLDPSRPVRGGRPGARRHSHAHEERINPDNIKRGKIVAIQGLNVLVDIGGKSQGVVPLEQFDQPTESEPEKKGIEVGQEYEFIYKGYDAREGLVILARKGAIQHGAWETLSPGDTVEAMVTGVNKGGLELRVGTTRAFMPAGQVDTKFHQDLSVFLNQKMPVRVMKVDREDHNIVLSRRAIMEEAEAKMAEQTWGELAVGQVREGTVRSVQPYGAFIDLGGVDGLLHVSAMSHQRVSDPKKIVQEGSKIQVMIIGLDKDKKRVSLSLKQLAKDPWDTVEQDFPVGTTVDGTVKKVVEFGAFVELAPGVEGLVHVSQLALKRINRPGEVVKDGDKVRAKILGIDREKRRISLSMAEAERDAKIASGELPPEPAKPAAAVGAGAGTGAGSGGGSAAKAPAKPKKHLKGGL